MWRLQDKVKEHRDAIAGVEASLKGEGVADPQANNPYTSLTLETLKYVVV